VSDNLLHCGASAEERDLLDVAASAVPFASSDDAPHQKL
jgi:hypothetical protein